ARLGAAGGARGRPARDDRVLPRPPRRGRGVKILVTGGAGFIGSHVAEAYLAAGHEVALRDDLSTGREANCPAGARLHRADVRDREAVAAILAQERPEVLSHHAAQMDVRRSVADPVLDAQINLIGLLNLLEEG